MKTLYKIIIDPDAPKLDLYRDLPYYESMKLFCGDSKKHFSKDAAFPAKPDKECQWQQLYFVAPGCFAIMEEAWEKCEEMYYILGIGNELLAAGDSTCYFRIVNPLDFAPPSDNPCQPCDLYFFKAPIFRLKNYMPTELFCISDTEVGGDQFKHCYEKFGFRGLIFDEVWRDK